MAVLGLGCTSSGGIIKFVSLSLLIAFLWLKCKLSICVFLFQWDPGFPSYFLNLAFVIFVCLLFTCFCISSFQYEANFFSSIIYP
jgi:hypothetical protein